MSKTNEYYRILQEDEDFKEYEKEVGSLVESHLPKPRSKEAKENFAEAASPSLVGEYSQATCWQAFFLRQAKCFSGCDAGTCPPQSGS